MARKPDSQSLERPWVQLKLIRQLAVGEFTQRELAAKYDCTQGAIAAFNNRHRERVEEVKADLANEFAGLWAVKKNARIALYERQCEVITAHMEQHGPDAPLTRALQAAQRGIAEELGDLPIRATVDINANVNTRIQIVGDGGDFDPDKDL